MLALDRAYGGQQPGQPAVLDYIERFYNPRRRHSTIRYMSPMEFEA